MKAFKVVTKDRNSCCTELYLFEKMPDRYKEILKKKRIIKHYKFGSYVKAAKCAGPILCFRTFADAKYWAERFFGDYKIIKVRGFEEETPKIMSFIPIDWLNFIEYGDIKIGYGNPTGTIGFRRIKVLT